MEGSYGFKSNLNFLLLFLIPFILFFSVNCSKTDTRETVSRGTLDLRGHTFQDSAPVSLSGDYYFYPHKFMDPKNLIDSHKSSLFLKVPSFWNSNRESGIQGPRGYATYALRILLPPDHPPLGLRVSVQGPAYEIFANNKSVYNAGVPSITKEGESYSYRSEIIYLPGIKDQLDLVFHVSNHSHRTGGLWNGFSLGVESELRKRDAVDLSMTTLLFSVVLVVGLFHLGLFFHRRDDIPSLYFSLVSIDTSLRIITTNNILLTRIFTDFPFFLIIKLSYISFYTGVPLFFTFVVFFFHEPKRKIILRAVWPPAILFTIHTIITPALEFTNYLYLYQILTIIWILGGIYLWIRAINRKEPGAILSLAGALFIFFTVAVDIIAPYFIYFNTDIAPLGLLAFITVLSHIQIASFVRGYRANKKLGEIDHELEFAKQVQSRILTPESYYSSLEDFEISVVYLPMNGKVSGDYYNISRREDRMAFFIADATGHGVQAALTTMQIDMLFKTMEMAYPSECFIRFNHIMLENLKSPNFFTGFIAEVKGTDMIYSSAGHPMQYLLQTKRRNLVSLKTHGKPVGMFRGNDYRTFHSFVEKGDILLLFTDGIIEEMDQQGDFYDSDQMEIFIKSLLDTDAILTLNMKDLNEALLQNIRNYVGHTRQTDDFTIMSIKIN